MDSGAGRLCRELQPTLGLRHRPEYPNRRSLDVTKRLQHAWEAEVEIGRCDKRTLGTAGKDPLTGEVLQVRRRRLQLRDIPQLHNCRNEASNPGSALRRR